MDKETLLICKSRENVLSLRELNVEMLNYLLQNFELEVLEQDESEYPPPTLFFIVCG